MKTTIFLLLLLWLTNEVDAQTQPTSSIKGSENTYTRVPPPSLWMDRDELNSTATCVINVEFDSLHFFPDSLKAPIRRAAEIWSYLIKSDVPIRIFVRDTTDTANKFLMQCQPFIANPAFPGSPDTTYKYPYSLAEAISGQNLNANGFEMEISVATNYAWYVGTDGNVPANTFDAVSVSMHEMGHGFGFHSEFRCLNGYGFVQKLPGQPSHPSIFDKYLIVGPNHGTSIYRLTNSEQYPDSSIVLGDQLESDNVYFDGTNAYYLGRTVLPKVWAPRAWKNGTSLSHLDSLSYTPGNANSLMAPIAYPATSIHSPGELGVGIMLDLGWDMNRMITVTSPSAGKYVRQGSLDTIQWTDSKPNGSGYFVELWRRNSMGNYTYYSQIAFRFSNPGLNSLVWTANVDTGTYRVKMLDEAKGYGMSSAFRVSNMNQVAQPTFDPSPNPSGGYGMPFPVTIRTTTPAPVAIYYRTDGMNVTNSNGTPYDSLHPPVLTNTTTLVARAYKDGFIESDQAVGRYVFIPGTSLSQRTERDSLFGFIKYYSRSDGWRSYPSGSVDTFAVGVTHHFLAERAFAPQTMQKFRVWELNRSTVDFRRWGTIPVLQTVNTLVAPFKTAYNARLAAAYLEGSSMEDSLEVQDPWLADTYDEFVQDSIEQGMSAPFKKIGVTSLDWNLGISTAYKGIFLDQTPSQGTYYSVRAPLTSLDGNGVPCPFVGWSSDKASFVHVTGNPAGYDQKAVVFSDSNAVVTGLYKAHLRSTAGAFASNNQRKVAQSASGVYCIVYTSANRVWFTKHTGGSASAEYEVSAGSYHPLNTAPSICASGDMINVVWQSSKANPIQSGDDFRIYLRRYNAATNVWGPLEQITNGSLPSSSFSTTPVIDAECLTPNGQGELKRLIWRDPACLKMVDCYEGAWEDATDLSGTDENSCNPSIAFAASGSYHIAWEDASTGSILFSNSGQTPVQISPGGWTENRRPSIGKFGAGQAVVTWESFNNITEGGSSVHVRKTTQGTWDGQITSFSMEDAGQLAPVVGTIDNGTPFSVAWTYGTSTYRASWNGSSWYGPVQTGSIFSEVNVNLRAVGQLQEVWRFTDGTARIGGTRYSLYPGKVDVEGSPDFNWTDSSATRVDYRVNRHALIDLPGSLPSKNGFRGTLAFELASLKVANPSEEKTLPLSPGEMRSEPFTVTSQFPELKLAGAIYGAGLEVPPKVATLATDPLARLVVKDAKSGSELREVWNVPFSSLSQVSDGAFGAFRQFALDLSPFVGREVTVEVDLIGKESDVEPIIVTDYLIRNRGSNQIAKSDAGSADAQIPGTYMLHQNYPNPFNPTTTIRFDLPRDGHVTLKIFSVLGEEVLTLQDGNLPAGLHSRVADLTGLPTGIYLYRISAGEFSDVKKLVLVK